MEGINKCLNSIWEYAINRQQMSQNNGKDQQSFCNIKK